MLVNMLKYHRFIIGFLTCVLTGLLPNLVWAFTLGDIRLNSALNEPLSANIELLELDGLNESQILVTLGSEADFQRVGVEPLPLYNELEFEVDVLSASEGVVRISSADAIVEPYLNFVLNVRWPSGRVIREYTVLLDLPTFTANPIPAPAPDPARSTPTAPPARPAAPQVEPEPVQSQIAEVQEPEPEAVPAPAPVFEEPSNVNSSPETVVIQSGDSMWNIALATRPDNDVSVQQMMLAIQRANANSDAFIGNNINGIRAGRVLRIPSRQEINAISQEQAITQVAVQNQQFSNNAQPLAINNSQGGSRNTRDELSIVNRADDESDNAEIADLNATIANLENELSLSEENLDRALLENEELRGRLNDLEEEIAILENIIAIEAQRMAELQESIAQQNNATTSDVLAVAPPQNPAPVDVAPVAPSPAPSTGIIGQISNLLSSTLGMIVALVVLLALVVGFLIARNPKASLKEDDFDAILAEDDELNFAEDSKMDADLEEGLLGDESTGILDNEDEENNEIEQEDFDQEDSSGFDDDVEDDFQDDDNDTEDDFTDDDDSNDDDDFSEDSEEDEEPAKTGFLAGLLAKFTRKKAEDSDDEDIFDEYDEDDDSDDDSSTADEFVAADSSPFDEDIEDQDLEDEDIEDASEESVLDDDFENFLQDIKVDDEDDDVPVSNESSDPLKSEEPLDFYKEELVEASGEFDKQDQVDEIDEIVDLDETDTTEDSSSGDVEEIIEFNEEAVSKEALIEGETQTKSDSGEEVFEFNLDESPKVNNDVITDHVDKSKDSDEIESLSFSLPDKNSEVFGAADSAHDNELSDDKNEEVETFDFGEIAFETEDQKTKNAETPSADKIDSPEDSEAIEISEDDSDLEEIVFDLDDSNSENEIEFLDSDDDENPEGIKEASSSLGNLGLDDAIAFDESDEEELEVITDQDEVSTKLDLAVAYQAMDDIEGAKEILDEVIAEGNDDQIAEAKKLLNEWGVS